MTYRVKEIFYTVQGEGAQSGRPAVFLRFAGCNLWSGDEVDRERARCTFCDTDFVGTDGENGGHYAKPADLVEVLDHVWAGQGAGPRFVVCTGGEPLLQLDEPLIDGLHAASYEVAVETNGTIKPPDGIDWLCVSPKAGNEVVVKAGQELKLVYPQEGQDPETMLALDFDHFYLQPKDGDDHAANTKATLAYCMANPQWRFGLQSHKVLGVQ